MSCVARVFGFAFFCFLSTCGLAQDLEHQEIAMTYHNSIDGEYLWTADRPLNIELDKEIEELIHGAKVAQGWSTFFLVFGGGLIVWPIASSISGNNPFWGLAVVGVNFACAAIPFAVSAKNKKKRASFLLQESYSSSSLNQRNFSLSFSAYAGGVGLFLTF